MLSKFQLFIMLQLRFSYYTQIFTAAANLFLCKRLTYKERRKLLKIDGSSKKNLEGDLLLYISSTLIFVLCVSLPFDFIFTSSRLFLH